LCAIDTTINLSMGFERGIGVFATTLNTILHVSIRHIGSANEMQVARPLLLAGENNSGGVRIRIDDVLHFGPHPPYVGKVRAHSTIGPAVVNEIMVDIHISHGNIVSLFVHHT
jgi:hypothetical protein